MGKIGYGYGSEFHLLRWMGRHRSEINRLVLASLDKEGSDINWLDFPFAGSGKSLDAEWKGLDFLPKNSSIKKQWADFWPTGKGIHNWDLVGRLNKSDKAEWILVEAKAHIGEINSSCTATAQQSINKIAEAFESVKKSFGVDKARNWMSPYYQHTNRISVLGFCINMTFPPNYSLSTFVEIKDRLPTKNGRQTVLRIKKAGGKHYIVRILMWVFPSSIRLLLTFINYSCPLSEVHSITFEPPKQK
jgi:hypothetical protein